MATRLGDIDFENFLNVQLRIPIEFTTKTHPAKPSATDSDRNCDSGSLNVQPFWLLVASLVRGMALPLLQCPYYQHTGVYFSDLRTTGWVNPLVLIQ